MNIGKNINSIIVGRNNEIETINRLFDTVLEGGFTAVLIKGQSGVGKTFLVDHITKELQRSHITFVQGKHVQHSQKSYTALAEIIEGIFEHILTLPIDEYKIIINKIEKEMGANVDFIYNLSPSAKKIFNINKTKPKDYPKSKYQIRKTIEKFFLCISETFFPLVVFFDDIQWADDATIDILTMLCKQQNLYNFMLIMAARNNMKVANNQIDNVATVINLNALCEEEIITLLKTIFGQAIPNTLYLGRLIYSLTLGNPFYVKKTIELFCQEGVFIYDNTSKNWISDINKINHITLPKNMKQIIKLKMLELKPDETLLLNYMACLNGRATLNQLQMMIDLPITTCQKIIQNLCEKSFIILSLNPIDSNGHERITYQFVHDIILEWVYEEIDKSAKEQIHYQIVKKTIKQVNTQKLNEHLSFVTSQLVCTNINDWTIKEKDYWLTLLFEAGKQALDLVDYERGIELFNICKQILDECKSGEKLKRDVLLALAKCQYYLGDCEIAENIFQELILLFNKTQDVIYIKRCYMDMLAFKGEDAQVLEIGKEVLVLLNESYNISGLEGELGVISQLYTDDAIEKLADKPELDNQQVIVVLQTLYQMMTSAQIVDDMQFMYILIKIAVISAKEGYSDYSSIGYGASAYVFYHIINNQDRGKQLSEVALSFAQQVEDERMKVKALAFFATFVHPWANPLNKTIQLLEQINESCLELGEVVYCEYTIASLMFAYCVNGTNLNELKNKLHHRITRLEKLGISNKQFTVQVTEKSVENHIKYLTQGVSGSIEGAKISSQNLDSAQLLVSIWFHLQDTYLSGNLSQVYAIVDNIKEKLDRAKGHIIYIEVVFYCLLIRMEYHTQLDRTLQQENADYINDYLQILEQTCEHYADNHQIRLLYARGMHDNVFNQGHTTAGLYNEGILLAQQKENSLLEALGNLLASRYYCEHIKLAQFYESEASRCFKKWGAIYIAKQLTSEEVNNQSTETNNQQNKIDLITSKSIREIEKLDETQSFTYMLNTMVTIASCHYGAILFEKSDEMYVYYEKKRRSKAMHYTNPMVINYKADLSHKMIRYVARTGKIVSIMEKPLSGTFAHDKYIQEKESVAIYCTPFYYFNILIGVIYLESDKNNGINGDVSKLINGVMPTLMSKCQTIKDISLVEVLNPTKNNSLLSERETHVIKLVAQGLSNQEISEQIFISTGTVKNHLSSIYNKLDVDNRMKAVVRAKELNIL